MSIVQVAKLAGCSHTTVSRVINQKLGVSLKVTARVQRAIQKLNYVPPVRKRGPVPKFSRSARTGNVAVLMIGTEPTPLVSPVAAAAVHAMESELADCDCSMSLDQLGPDEKLPPVVARGDVDGLILHGHPPSAEPSSRLKQIPSVWMMSPRSETGYWGDRVCPDDAAVGCLAARYLIDRGHERIGCEGTWWLVGASAFMARLSAWTFTGAAGAAYDAGWLVMVIFFAHAAGFILGAIGVSAWFRQLRVVTVPEAIRDRFGSGSQQSYAWIGVVTGVLYASVWLSGLALFCAAVFGFPMIPLILAIGVVVRA